MKNRRHNLENQRFGRLLVVGRDPKNMGVYLCVCDCGGSKTAYPYFLLKGKVKSCGCLRIEASRAKAEKYRKHFPERNAAVYELVAVKGRDVAEVAKEFNLHIKNAKGIVWREKNKRKIEICGI